jgi:hypothetical protein
MMRVCGATVTGINAFCQQIVNPPDNLRRQALTGRQQAIETVDEAAEPVFNAVSATQIVFQQQAKASLCFRRSAEPQPADNKCPT